MLVLVQDQQPKEVCFFKQFNFPVNFTDSFVEAGEFERLSGKLLVDTYSKRSKTLIEKVRISTFNQLRLFTRPLQGRELEQLTGAYVVIYTARSVIQ